MTRSLHNRVTSEPRSTFASVICNHWIRFRCDRARLWHIDVMGHGLLFVVHCLPTRPEFREKSKEARIAEAICQNAAPGTVNVDRDRAAGRDAPDTHSGTQTLA